LRDQTCENCYHYIRFLTIMGRCCLMKIHKPKDNTCEKWEWYKFIKKLRV